MSIELDQAVGQSSCAIVMQLSCRLHMAFLGMFLSMVSMDDVVVVDVERAK